MMLVDQFPAIEFIFDNSMIISAEITDPNQIETIIDGNNVYAEIQLMDSITGDIIETDLEGSC